MPFSLYYLIRLISDLLYSALSLSLSITFFSLSLNNNYFVTFWSSSIYMNHNINCECSASATLFLLLSSNGVALFVPSLVSVSSHGISDTNIASHRQKKLNRWLFSCWKICNFLGRRSFAHIKLIIMDCYVVEEVAMMSVWWWWYGG